jgi:hypothetical protein
MTTVSAVAVCSLFIVGPILKPLVVETPVEIFCVCDAFVTDNCAEPNS